MESTFVSWMRDKSQAAVGKKMLGLSEFKDRQALYAELNAIAYELLSAPAQLSQLVVLLDRQWADQERNLICQLCQYFGCDFPDYRSDDYSIDLKGLRLRWERHTEFSTYTFYYEGVFDVPFDDPVIQRVPSEWLASLPGKILVATHVALDDRSRPKRSLTELATLFSSNTVIGSRVAGGGASVWSDNQIHNDGFGRILIHDENLRSRQVGRLVQRLLEIETYRMLAMIPVPMVREIIPELACADQQLAGLIENNAETVTIEDEQELLDELTKLASQIEHLSARVNHRINASRAYYDIVRLRVSELREDRIEGLQMLQEYLEQRLSSAMGTCELVYTKLETLSLRVARASDLLQTRVDISMEAQIRDLLKSMDNRAQMQLRLQETVEGLSVVVLSYYLLGIVNYGLKAGKSAGMDINVELVTGIAIPVVVLVVFLAVNSLRRLVKPKNLN